jgi:hypothetical protein
LHKAAEAINDPDEAAPRLEGILRADDVVSLLTSDIRRALRTDQVDSAIGRADFSG